MQCDYSYSHSIPAATINSPQKGIQIILTQMSNLVLYDDRTEMMAKRNMLPARPTCHVGPRLAKGRSPTKSPRLAGNKISQNT